MKSQEKNSKNNSKMNREVSHPLGYHVVMMNRKRGLNGTKMPTQKPTVKTRKSEH
jgi:hypothetical protein